MTQSDHSSPTRRCTASTDITGAHLPDGRGQSKLEESADAAIPPLRQPLRISVSNHIAIFHIA
eukprot:1861454-Prorocentrum_lima.AAC.1